MYRFRRVREPGLPRFTIGEEEQEMEIRLRRRSWRTGPGTTNPGRARIEMNGGTVERKTMKYV